MKIVTIGILITLGIFSYISAANSKGSSPLQISSSSTTFLGSTIGYFNGLYYITDLAYVYNPLSNDLYDGRKTNHCGSDTFITADGRPWCISAKKDNLGLLNPNETQLINSYNVPSEFGDPSNFYVTSGNGYIVYTGDKNKHTAIFDTNMKKFICDSISYYENITTAFPIFDGFNLIRMKDSKSLDVYACSGGKEIETKFQFNPGYSSQAIFSFFNSAIFTNVLTFNNYSSLYIFVYDFTGQIYFGSNYTFRQIEQFNDTHIFALDNSGENLVLSLYTFNINNLSLSWAYSYNTNIISDPNLTATIIMGTNTVFVNIEEDVTGFIFDFSQQEIVSGSSIYPPINFANGGSVNLSASGYLIQQEQGASIQYVPVPIDVTYQNPSNLDQFWTLHFPDINNSSCILLDFQGNNNDVVSTNFGNCPTLTGQPQILDVNYDSDGDPIVAYNLAENANSVYFVSQNQNYNLSMKYAVNSLTFDAITQNGYYSGSDSKNMYFCMFNLTSGQDINCNSISLADNNVVKKLDDQYYLLTQSDKSYTYLYVVDMFTLKTFYNTKSSTILEAMDLDGSFIVLSNSTSPSYFNGVVGYDKSNHLTLLSSTGVATDIHDYVATKGEGFLLPQAENEFYYVDFDGSLMSSNISLYEVLNWS